MIFLIHYDRKLRQLISLRQFKSREEASTAKLAIEIETLTTALNQEVVVLEADSEESLRRTHQRYFSTLENIREAEAKSLSDKSPIVKFWTISQVAGNWLVKAEGMPDSTYPSKEHAVAAASLDAKSWTSSSGRPSGYKVRAADTTFTEQAIFLNG